MPSENIAQQRIRLALGTVPGLRIFRQNVGKLWSGSQRVKGPRQNVNLGPRDLLIRDARIVSAGLCQGSSDLVGWQSVEITPDMVGLKVAVFVALEVKGERGRATPEQKNFVERVLEAGGRAAIVKTPDEAKASLGIE